MKCLQCGQTFAPPANNPAQKFCSRACYEMYRALPNCLQCGRKFKPASSHPSQAFCSRSCYNKHRAGSNPPNSKKPTATKPLEQWTKEAAECNLDYGSYRAFINSGKTFEELKSTAHLRTLPAHSHPHLQSGMKGEKLT